MRIKYKNRDGGVSIIETIIYVSILAVVSVLVVNMLIAMFTTFTHARIKKRLVSEGGGALERIVREIRLASSVSDSGLEVDLSSVELNTVTSWTDTTSITKEFYVTNSQLFIQEGAIVQELTSPDVSITRFRVYKIATTNSEALKVELVLSLGSGSDQISQTFFTTVVLRGSYP